MKMKKSLSVIDRLLLSIPMQPAIIKKRAIATIKPPIGCTGIYAHCVFLNQIILIFHRVELNRSGFEIAYSESLWRVL